MLKRSDNLINHHFQKFHPEATSKRHPFLLLGECPTEGTDHVIKFLDIVGSETRRPKLAKISKKKQIQLKQSSESEYNDSQDVYDQHIHL